jgi:2-methylene-furan-3-one reductase
MLAVRDAGVYSNRDRILVLGGSSAVGSGIVQLAKDAGASFIAATSTDEPLLTSLGADMVIDYRTQNWWEIPEFKTNPFDTIFDCAEGYNAWLHAKDDGVLKTGLKGGCFIGVIADNPTFELHSMWDIFRELSSALLGRPIWTFVCLPFVPKFKTLFGAPRGNSLVELFKLVEEGRIKAVIDPKSPFPFTEDGAKAAFKLQASRHAHGKIVVQIQSSN